jgi:hypothetical protein
MVQILVIIIIILCVSLEYRLVTNHQIAYYSINKTLIHTGSHQAQL